MRNIFLCIVLFYLTESQIQLPYSERCACSEYSQNECNRYFYCSWDGYECGDLVCDQLSQAYCVPINTMFKCQWDVQKSQCIYQQQTCIQITEEKFCDFKAYHGLDCLWNNSTGCSDFSCRGSSKQCDLKICSYQDGVCDNPISSINCQAVSSESCLQSDGQNQICLPNDDLRCTAYDLKTNCPQFSDNQIFCNFNSHLCVYESNKCRFIECEDFLNEADCYYAYNESTDELTVCYWTGARCRTASDADLADFSYNDCIRNTRLNYKWEDSKCQQCKFGFMNGVFCLLLALLSWFI